jgi:hypothetical protein
LTYLGGLGLQNGDGLMKTKFEVILNLFQSFLFGCFVKSFENESARLANTKLFTSMCTIDLDKNIRRFGLENNNHRGSK